MGEAEEELHLDRQDDAAPSGVRRIGLVMFMTAAAVVFVVALLMALD